MKQSIIESIAAVASAILSGFIRLNNAIAPTIISIDSDILISILPALSACSPAYCETYISAAIITSKAAITAIPLKISPGDIRFISFIVATIINIAADIPSNIRPAFPALCPTKFDIIINAMNISIAILITLIPFCMSPAGILAIILILMASILIAIDIVRSILPALAPFSPAKKDTKIIPANRASIAAIVNRPLAISLDEIPAIIFIANPIITIANPILPISLAALSELFPESLEIAIIPAYKAVIPAVKINPLAMSLADKLPINLKTKAIKPIESDNLAISLAALSIFCAAFPLTNVPYTYIRPASMPISNPISRTAFIASPNSTSVSFRIAFAIISTATDIPTMNNDIRAKAVGSNREAASIKRDICATRAAITPSAGHILSVSILVNR